MFVFGPEASIPEKRQVCNVATRRCDGCHLFKANGGPCGGCSEHCTTKVCNTQCGTCGGHEPEYVGAICCKSPLKDVALLSVDKEYAFKKVDPIVPAHKAVLVVIGGKSSVCPNESPYDPGWDTIAVNLRHVWSARGGWYSQDLKDYMMIPKEKKLVLLTAMYDGVLDEAWKQDLFDGFREVGFNYWAPLVFSIYGQSPSMSQWWNHKRTEYSLHASEGHFWAGDIASADFPGAKEQYKRAMAAVPNVIVNMQLLDSSEAGLRNTFVCLRRLHEMMPPHGVLWLTGVGTKRLLKIALVAAPGREVVTTSTAPWIVPHKGKLLTRAGKIERLRDRPKKELLFESQKNFLNMVDDCHAEVGSLTAVVKPATNRYPLTRQAGIPKPKSRR